MILVRNTLPTIVWSLLLLGATGTACGQAAKPPAVAAAPTGSVTGRVFAEDSKTAIRLARATLMPISDGAPSDSRTRSGRSNIRTALSSADGVFTITAVPPGDYYLAASAAGYISTWDEVQWKLRSGIPKDDVVNRLTRVHVSAEISTTANLTLTHGAVIAGRVEWEDGTPATTLQVFCRPMTGFVQLPSDVMALAQAGNGNESARTDDRGEFRVAGLAPNEYTLMVVVTQQNVNAPGRTNFINLQVYSPGVFRRTEAQHYKLGSGEERNDVRIVLNLSRVHTVSGRVVSSVPNHVLSGGRVLLTEVRQPTGGGESSTGYDAVISRDINFDAQGAYSIPYVPSGNFAVQVLPQWDEGHNGEDSPEDIRVNSSLQNVTVGDTDLSGVDITLTPQPK